MQLVSGMHKKRIRPDRKTSFTNSDAACSSCREKRLYVLIRKLLELRTVKKKEKKAELTCTTTLSAQPCSNLPRFISELAGYTSESCKLH